MMSNFYSEIDWTQAWFASVLPAANKIVKEIDWRDALNQNAADLRIVNHIDLPLEFIPQEDLPVGVAYESHISQTGKVPTRENLHDFFNALVWLSFPKIKRQLNALQAAQIVELGIGKSRGPARDAATIFDENAAIMVLADTSVGHDLLTDLRAHHWKHALFVNAVQFEQHAQIWLFGHALMEKLVKPYKAITAHTWVVWASPEFFLWEDGERQSWVDEQVARQLQNRIISTSDYTPLPVLGVPGWWQDQTASFYDDVQVFRPKRHS
jgi:hypothetical protein